MTLKELVAVCQVKINIGDNGLIMLLASWPILLDAFGNCVISRITAADDDEIEVELKKELVRE